jgi:hypothetical protein
MRLLSVHKHWSGVLLYRQHRVYRVPKSPGLSSEVASPTPSTASECSSPPVSKWRGNTHSLAGRGWGEPIQTKGQTLWYTVY